MHGAELIVAVGLAAQLVGAYHDDAIIICPWPLDGIGKTNVPAGEEITLAGSVPNHAAVSAEIGFALDIETFPHGR